MSVYAERYLQLEIFLQLKSSRLPIVAFPIPNQVNFPAKTPAERTICARMIHMMKQTGQLIPGAPDIVLMWDGGGAYVEVKRPASPGRARGTSSPAQKEVAKRCGDAGVRYVVVESWGQLLGHLREWGVAE